MLKKCHNSNSNSNGRNSKVGENVFFQRKKKNYNFFLIDSEAQAFALFRGLYQVSIILITLVGGLESDPLKPY